MSIILPNGDRASKPEPPLRDDGTKKLSFETKTRKKSDGTLEKALFIDGEKLDWSVDVSSMMEAAKMGPKFFKVVQKDIERHFVESVSEFINRKITQDDIKEAIKTGWI